jgi:pyrroline-5-carboxylate reductase
MTTTTVPGAQQTTVPEAQQEVDSQHERRAALRVSFVGAGTMAEAIIRGLLQRKVVEPGDVVASAPRAERRAYLAETYGLRAVAQNAEAARDVDVVLLCVKPQTVPHVLPELREVLDTRQLVISIAAGVSLQTLESLSYHPAIVRSMPNTPAHVGEGMTVWVASHAVTPAQLAHTRTIFQALGREMQVDSEDFLDMATSISGCGPAYLFLVMEALTDAGVQIGLPRYIASELVTQTVLGAARLAQESTRHPAALKNAVTSPGGTAAAALYQLEKGGLRPTMADAVMAAYQRSIALGQADARAAQDVVQGRRTSF